MNVEKIINRLLRMYNKRKSKIINMARTGQLGNRVRLMYDLDCYYNRLLVPNEWKKELKQYKQYNEIRPHIKADVSYNRIGEFIPAFSKMIEDSDSNRKKGILDVLIFPARISEYNARVVKVLSRKYKIIMPSESEKWFFFLTHFKFVNYEFYNYYYACWDDKKRSVEETKNIVELNDDESSEGIDKSLAMGLDIEREFVCFSNRDEKYLDVTGGQVEGFYTYHNYRNSSVSTIDMAVDYLNSVGIQSIRMGKYPKEKYDHSGCIDYGSKYYDELMDIYLSQKCKFFVNDPSGVNTFSYLYGTPQVFKNDVALLTNSAERHYPDCKNSLLIFKKIWLYKENRYLTLKETIIMQHNMMDDHLQGLNAEKYGVRFVDNTLEEIRDVVVEMNERLDGTWIENEEDERLWRKAKDIIDECNDLYSFDRMWCFKGRIGSAFLRNNKEIFGLV